MYNILVVADWETASIFLAFLGAYGLIVTVVWKVAEHVFQKDLHPSKKDIVFRDVCETRHIGQSATWQAEFSAANQRIEDLKEQVRAGFAELKSLILKSNGHRP